MGWKDILRPIRDGFRDNLPPSRRPDHDEAERRRRQRIEDVLKGFAYFDTFEEVEQWTPESVDPLQRANTPLLCRAPVSSEDGTMKTKIVLVHDYSGNYHDYEACQGSSAAEETYSCEYMQFVDAFVYFSHKLVCVPPPTWTNSLHRNGVRSLGTFLVEPQTPGIARILERNACSGPSLWEYPYATQLVHMARRYGFDGWLLNIEKTFPLSKWSRERLEGFIAQVSYALGKENVIWYDALSVHNTLQYQNGLTRNNVRFAQAAGSILTNYDWTEEKALAAKQLALEVGMDPSNVLFGIDVWAQNSQSEGSRRRTFGGGGTCTGVAVAQLAKLGLGAAIFAPAWAYEHFSEHSKSVERAMWNGDKLPATLHCDCKPRGEHDTPEYLTHPITKFATEYSAGSDSFFYTDFARAFSRQSASGNGDATVSHVGAQSILPSLNKVFNTQYGKFKMREQICLYGEFCSQPSRIAVFIKSTATNSGGLESTTSSILELFKLSMAGTLEATIVYRKKKTSAGIDIRFVFAGADTSVTVSSAGQERVTVSRTLELGKREPGNLRTDPLPRKSMKIQLSVSGNVAGTDMTQSTPVLEILEICIRRRCEDERNFTICDIALSRRDNSRRRLTWNFRPLDRSITEASPEENGMPHSSVTGPFAFFLVKIDGEVAGRAYALEYLLGDAVGCRADAEQGMQVEIAGYGFDGTVLCVSADSVRDGGCGGEGRWQLVHAVGSTSDVTMQSV